MTVLVQHRLRPEAINIGEFNCVHKFHHESSFSRERYQILHRELPASKTRENSMAQRISVAAAAAQEAKPTAEY